MCVIYKWNFIIGMYVHEKQLIYGVHYLRFRLSVVGLGVILVDAGPLQSYQEERGEA